MLKKILENFDWRFILRTAGLTLIVEDPGCDETYEEGQRHDTQ